MNKIPFIKLEAKDNHDFGFNIGGKLKENIRLRIIKNKKAYKELGFDNFSLLVKKSKKFLPEVKKHFPELLTEAKAMSLGSGVNFEELLVLLCEEEVTHSVVPRCTSIAVKTTGGVILIGHNEDWMKEYLNNGLFLVRGKIKNKRFLSLSYMGSLVGTACTLTSDGLGFTGNSLTPGRFRYGIPKSFQMRAILDSKTEEEAIKADIKKSAISSNTLYVWDDYRMVNVEDYFGHCRKFLAKEYLIHTNHPLLKEDQKRINTSLESIKRYNRAKAIIFKEKNITRNTLKKILCDHEAGICGHFDKKHADYGVTIASAIINPEGKWMDVCHGNPCKNKYIRYFL